MTRTNILLTACASGFLLAACNKDSYTRTLSQIANRSAHNVRLLPYVGDSAYAHLAVSVSAGDSLEVYQTDAGGNETGAIWTSYLQHFDSVQVYFMDTTSALPRDTVHIGHMRNGVVPSYPKQVPYSSSRSLYNPGSWAMELVEETRYMLKSRYTYSFTEADYQAAR
jgi:hypothetical protein